LELRASAAIPVPDGRPEPVFAVKRIIKKRAEAPSPARPNLNHIKKFNLGLTISPFLIARPVLSP